MTTPTSRQTAVFIGNESLVVQCAEIWMDSGLSVSALITRIPEIAKWAREKSIAVIEADSDLNAHLSSLTYDWLLSVANLDMIAPAVLDTAQRGAVNFHDGPLPRYAGLNAPVWARLAEEENHAITWHLMAKAADTGDILVQQGFDISTNDTALTLNAKCYETAIDSFPQVIEKLVQNDVSGTPQDFSQRSYFSREQRPKAAARLDFQQDASEIVALVRALDFGDYFNPLVAPKIVTSGQVLLARSAEIIRGTVHQGIPGAVLSVTEQSVTVACGRDTVELGNLTDSFGNPVDVSHLIRVGEMLPSLDRTKEASLSEIVAKVAGHESFWRALLRDYEPATIPLVSGGSELMNSDQISVKIPTTLEREGVFAALAIWAAKSGAAEQSHMAFCPAEMPTTTGYLNDWVPLELIDTGLDHTVNQVIESKVKTLKILRKNKGFLRDLIARDPHIEALTAPDIGVTERAGGGLIDGTAMSFVIGQTADDLTLHFDCARLSNAHAARLVSRLELIAQNLTDPAILQERIETLTILPDAELHDVTKAWNDTTRPVEFESCVHMQFEEQAEKTPDATALVFGHQQLSYRDLNEKANQVAAVLCNMGVVPGMPVGLYCARSIEMMVAALGILKAGGAYVPLDPAYPADRLAHYISDSGAGIIISTSRDASGLEEQASKMLLVDTDPRIATAKIDNISNNVTGSDLAYLIYTSGSTGVPKGVMVEHRNVANFFVGMDERVTHDPAGTWLAVTSLSFDISVLELFYSLSRGFKVVISGDESRTQISDGPLPTGEQEMEFSLFYWGNDDEQGTDKYRLLLEGAKFGDENGFCAVWTPERHFHAFGGPYPNPAVTGAAVAAVTKNIGVRAGSCVAPLHHTARLAEEWSVVDNLTNGRAGLAIASGWQPDDFVLRPENTPPANRESMFQSIHQLRALWRGEVVDFPRKDGTMFGVRTQPRPVSDEIELWVTTAGNPETWKEAGRAGAHILTHLLGQSIEEVSEKIGLYHAELRSAGYDPDKFKVTLMLHTFVADTREKAREIAREPMKDYLRSAAGLIKQYAWAFPAFKKPKGVNNPFELDLGSLSEDELEGILDFAFLRYFEDSGLFGTVEDCLERVAQLKRFGVNEVACLIDYGIECDVVLEGLNHLAEVRMRSNSGRSLADEDVSIAAQIIRHDVTHLQCTPSMARMLVMNDEARFALSKVRHLMVGGEALPGALVVDLKAATHASIENMYGPTETTIWSTTARADANQGVARIGAPIANTQCYVLDKQQAVVPVGVTGELYIGGAGVTRGYWQRAEKTNECFVDDPFADNGSKMYRTGDLARWDDNGELEFFGRADQQVKLRGYRIELGEIETRLEDMPEVVQAVVVAKKQGEGDARLVAYLQCRTHIDDTDLRDRLSTNLPEFMVPSHFVALDSFPLTPNKKVDRAALPEPSSVGPAKRSADPIQVPEGETAQIVANIWSRTLGVSQISLNDNFFDLGGHSLLAVQAHREIRNSLKVDSLSITDVFRFPVLSALADRIDAKSGKIKKQAASVTVETESHIAASEKRDDLMAKRRAMRARRR
jgi:natural product biosynthesis luciferase-like monooxygenase protein